MSNHLTLLTTNRKNAQQSTGPRTGAGKHTSSLNSLRHGLTGSFVLLPAEDPEAYRLFVKSVQNNLQPDGAFEVQLAQNIANFQWRLNRIPSLEASVYHMPQLSASPDNASPTTLPPTTQPTLIPATM